MDDQSTAPGQPTTPPLTGSLIHSTHPSSPAGTLDTSQLKDASLVEAPQSPISAASATVLSLPASAGEPGALPELQANAAATRLARVPTRVALTCLMSDES
jgi:hypothetical protein